MCLSDSISAEVANGQLVYKHRGHCADGWMDGNTLVADLNTCAARCRDRASSGCGYIAFASTKTSGTNCNLYRRDANCPDDDNFDEYNAYTVLHESASLPAYRIIHPSSCSSSSYKGYKTVADCAAACKDTAGCTHFELSVYPVRCTSTDRCKCYTVDSSRSSCTNTKALPGLYDICAIPPPPPPPPPPAPTPAPTSAPTASPTTRYQLRVSGADQVLTNSGYATGTAFQAHFAPIVLELTAVRSSVYCYYESGRAARRWATSGCRRRRC